MRIWTYVIQDDIGAAPNYALPTVTLAICKPIIRRLARPGDIVLAFNGRRVNGPAEACAFPNPNTVRWAGVVSESVPFALYWDDPRFAGKRPGCCPVPDNIYRSGPKGLTQELNASHGPEHAGRDIGGLNALVFARSWRFGDEGPSLPARFGLWMTGGRRGQRRHDLRSEIGAALLAWLEGQAIAQTDREKVNAAPSACGRGMAPQSTETSQRPGSC